MTDIDDTPKLCGVCGDKALGKNFCALSCESCKAFFRRNASNYHKMKCYYGEKCRIDLEMRTICRKCRLKKCFAIGMRKEWILNDEEKEMRRRKIENNKHNKHKPNKVNTKTVDKSDDNSSSSQSLMATDNEAIDGINIIEILDNNNVSEEQISSQIKEIENSFVDHNHISEEAYKKALELELAVLPIPRPIHTNVFNETEGMRFTELIQVTSCFRSPVPKCTSQVFNFTDAVTVLIKKCDEEVREVVQAFKKLNAFRSMCESDQLLLLKYGAIQMICMRAVHCYDDSTENWCIPMDHDNATLVKLKILREHTIDLYFPLKQFLCRIGREYDSDETILDLLNAIVLFDPNHPNLTHREAIKLQQQVYMYLLQRYLQMKYGSECEAKSRFIRLMNGLTYSSNLHHKYIQCFLDALPPHISPLLNEIYDRRPHQNAITFTELD